MTTMELNAVLLRELSSIATNEDLLQKAIKCIKALKKEAKAKSAKEEVKPYTMEELNERIDRAEANYAAGRVTKSEQVHAEMKDFIASL